MYFTLHPMEWQSTLYDPVGRWQSTLYNPMGWLSKLHFTVPWVDGKVLIIIPWDVIMQYTLRSHGMAKYTLRSHGMAKYSLQSHGMS